MTRATSGDSPGTSLRTTDEVSENACLQLCLDSEKCLSIVYHVNSDNAHAGECELLDRYYEELLIESTSARVSKKDCAESSESAESALISDNSV
jgi:hypothetical protein